MARGSDTRHADRECNICKWFVEQDLINGVILLPDNLFYNTRATGIIIGPPKRKPDRRQGNIVFVNTSRRVDKGCLKIYMSEEELRPRAEMFLKGEPVEGEVVVMTREQAVKADYNLSPSRWMRQVDDTAQRSISEIIADLQLLDEESRQGDGHLAKMLAKLK